MEQRDAILLNVTKSRRNLLLVFVLTAVNIVMILMQSSITFPFSAIVPAFLAAMGRAFLVQYGSTGLFLVTMIAAVVIVLLYGLFYRLSKKRPVFLLVALIFFVADTLLLVWLAALDFDTSFLIDLAFHAWVLFELGRGARAWNRLRRLPQVQEAPGAYHIPPTPVAPDNRYVQAPPTRQTDDWSLNPDDDGQS